MGWTDTIFQWLGSGRYNATSPLLADGQVGELQLDAQGRLRVLNENAPSAGVGASRIFGGQPLAGGMLSGTPASLYELTGHAQDATTWYLMMFDTNRPPNEGAVPKQCFKIPAGGAFSYKFYDLPVAYVSGIVWRISSRGDVLTTPGTAALVWLEAVIR